jgi:hypothetical protein
LSLFLLSALRSFSQQPPKVCDVNPVRDFTSGLYFDAQSIDHSYHLHKLVTISSKMKVSGKDSVITSFSDRYAAIYDTSGKVTSDSGYSDHKYVYNKWKEISRMNCSDNRVTNYYDASGRIIRNDYFSVSSNYVMFRNFYAYDDRGCLISRIEYQFVPSVSNKSKMDSSILESHHYFYNDKKQLIRKEDQDGPPSYQMTVYKYVFHYSASGVKVEDSTTSSTTSYTLFDTLGNILEMHHGKDESYLPVYTHYYHYANGKLVSITNSPDANKQDAEIYAKYTYCDNGLLKRSISVSDFNPPGVLEVTDYSYTFYK